MSDVTVIGGGLAGSEAAWQLAERGLRVTLVEMKPTTMSPAHQSPMLCELVCSNSLRSDDPATGPGLLKAELRALGSLVIACADAHSVPAGGALAVDRDAFGAAVTRRLEQHPNVRLERRVADELPDGPTVLATGPLTGGALAERIKALAGDDRLYFYDAIAPIVAADSVDPERSFRASRWGKGEGDGAGEGDYINCPLDEAEYRTFVGELLAGRKVEPREFEDPVYFEGCLPIEVMAERGTDTLRFGPMKPVGLTDPRTGRRPYAVVQLRPENRYLTAYNLVGFQTRLAYPEQQRIFGLIPALRDAEFLRLGAIHRNTFIDSPSLLGPALELRDQPNVHIAGLLTGVEGYIESCAMGLLAALFAAARLRDEALTPPPPTTAFGALYAHVTTRRAVGEAFQPTNINFGLLPPLQGKHAKRDRKRLMSERARADLARWAAHARAEGEAIEP